ncbi:hypothetical protein GYMLUDRAFT_779806 [Collybiopsis luxurians FD-317 M1]|uniref:Uncharacterized protein n=1 Tax=Collybiopsis luxurians FD-317 M1 TaxID=944289 RepID=A0A0D0BNQ9_9AGAR|nr:hypothetical protein GYMLUDRAFT_779806 [Collybiopsis luxurians FD-317 M1]
MYTIYIPACRARDNPPAWFSPTPLESENQKNGSCLAPCPIYLEGISCGLIISLTFLTVYLFFGGFFLAFYSEFLNLFFASSVFWLDLPGVFQLALIHFFLNQLYPQLVVPFSFSSVDASPTSADRVVLAVLLRILRHAPAYFIITSVHPIHRRLNRICDNVSVSFVHSQCTLVYIYFFVSFPFFFFCIIFPSPFLVIVLFFEQVYFHE